MTTKLIIRELKKEDKSKLKALIKDFYQYSLDTFLTGQVKEIDSASDMKLYLEEHFKDYLKNVTFVAELEGNIIGFIEGEIRERKGKVYNLSGLIQNFFVKEEVQSQGIGRKLFDKITEGFKEKGCNSMRIEAYVTNHKAISIYKNWGFMPKNVAFVRKI